MGIPKRNSKKQYGLISELKDGEKYPFRKIDSTLLQFDTKMVGGVETILYRDYAGNHYAFERPSQGMLIYREDSKLL